MNRAVFVDGKSIAFELTLLRSMAKSVRNGILAEIGMTDDEDSRLRDRYALSTPDRMFLSFEYYRSVFGDPVMSELMGDRAPDLFKGSEAHYFVPVLWPHLFWVVNRVQDGRIWGVGFQNQIRFPNDGRFDPSVVRVGVWTRTALESLANRVQIYDGWDEQVVLQLSFERRTFVGSFSYGLLQEWREM